MDDSLSTSLTTLLLCTPTGKDEVAEFRTYPPLFFSYESLYSIIVLIYNFKAMFFGAREGETERK